MKFDTKTLCIIAMLSTMAFILATFVRIPVMLWLRYDPKDVIITIGGFMFGPLAALSITIVVSFLQLVTTSATGWFGFFMNVVSSASFCCTAAIIYQKKRTMKGAILGLVIAGIFSTAVMMMWNYIIVPIFMETTREEAVQLLVPVFLPFNVLSNTANAALTVVVYKHVRKALQVTKLMPKTQEGQKSANKWILFTALFVLLTCVLWWLILRGVLTI